MTPPLLLFSFFFLFLSLIPLANFWYSFWLLKFYERIQSIFFQSSNLSNLSLINTTYIFSTLLNYGSVNLKTNMVLISLNLSTILSCLILPDLQPLLSTDDMVRQVCYPMNPFSPRSIKENVISKSRVFSFTNTLGGFESIVRQFLSKNPQDV